MSDPITIGAGIGAGTSLLTGGNPFTGALMGGAGGGFGQALGKSNFLGSLFNGVGTNAMAGGDILKGATMNASMAAPNFLGTPKLDLSLLGQTTTSPILTGGGNIPLNAFDKIGNAVNSVTAPFENFAAENPFVSRVGANVLSNQIMGSQSPQSSQMQFGPLSQIPIIPGRDTTAGRVTGLRTTPRPLAGRNINFGGYQG
jgi:hypothetical protein